SEEAIRLLKHAVSLAPSMVPARITLARAYNAAEQGPEAEAEARAAMELGGRTFAALRAYGNSVGLQNRHEEALAAFDEALSIRPESAAAKHERAVALHKLGRSDESRAILESLYQQGPATPELYQSLSTLCFDEHDIDGCIDWLRKGVREHPLESRLQTGLARMRWMRGDGADAFAVDLEAAVKSAPDDVVLRTNYAELLYRVERIDEAIALMREGIARTPERARLWSMFGFLLEEKGEFDEAIAALKRANAGGGEDESRKLLTNALLRAGRADEALPLIAAGRQAQPKDQIWLTYLATAHRMRGDKEFDYLCDLDRFVRVVDLAPPPGYATIEEFNAALAAKLDAQHILAAHPLNQTLREGTQTPRDLTEIDEAEIQIFTKLAHDAVQDFTQSLPWDERHPFTSRRTNDVTFSGCWSVRLRAGGKHVNHIHNKGWVSSAYYVRLPPKRADDAPHAGWIKFGEPRQPMPGCTPLRYIEPKVGRLVLFPSYMWHGTEPFTHDDRLTCAFDMVPV
ncbi:MAG: 2OG-Fe(II) oxygenase family protein, partial [Hyphomonadaceae bacterium]